VPGLRRSRAAGAIAALAAAVLTSAVPTLGPAWASEFAWASESAWTAGSTIGPVQINPVGHPRLCWQAGGPRPAAPIRPLLLPVAAAAATLLLAGALLLFAARRRPRHAARAPARREPGRRPHSHSRPPGLRPPTPAPRA
jgi:hypothetical protein